MWQRQADWTGRSSGASTWAPDNRANWAQLFQFGVVGAAGYIVNLTVLAVLTLAFDLPHHIAAAILAFCVAVSDDFVLNGFWTFRETAGQSRRRGFQATRFFAVSLAGFVNLAVLSLLVDALGRPTFPRRRSRWRWRSASRLHRATSWWTFAWT